MGHSLLGFPTQFRAIREQLRAIARNGIAIEHPTLFILILVFQETGTSVSPCEIHLQYTFKIKHGFPVLKGL